MPRGQTRDGTGEFFTFYPVGADGLDYFSNSALASPGSLVRGENIRLADGALSRRLGPLRVYRVSTDPNNSKTFGADTKYGTITAATQLQIPAGGFAVRVSFTAVRPSAGNTGYILSSRVNGQTYHVLSITLDENGLCSVTWRKNSSAADVTVTTSAITANAAAHLLAVYDADAGTFTVYINGDASGTPVSGLGTSEKPIAGAGTNWHFGVHYNPATPGVVANTHFDGKIDAFALFTLAGTRPGEGSSVSLASVLRKHSLRQWPNPEMGCVLACYDFDDSSLTVLTDRSRYKNHGTMTGTPTHSAAVTTKGTIPGNYAGVYETPAGKRSNIVAFFGNLYHEVIQGST